MKTNSVLMSIGFGSNILEMKIPASMGSSNRAKKHITHQKPNGNPCVLCQDEDHWVYPEGYVYGDSEGKEEGEGGNEGGNDPSSSKECECKCKACEEERIRKKKEKEEKEKKSFEELLEGLLQPGEEDKFTTKRNAKLKGFMAELGNEPWAQRFMSFCDQHNVDVGMYYDGDLKVKGENTVDTEYNKKTEEVTSGTVLISICDDQKHVVAHEAVEAYDKVQRRNQEGNLAEITSRMAETIMMKKNVINSTCAEDGDFNDTMWELLEDIVANKGDMEAVTQSKWDAVDAALQSIGYNIGTNRNLFDPRTILEIYEDYYGPIGGGDGNDDYGDGEEEDSYGDHYEDKDSESDYGDGDNGNDNDGNKYGDSECKCNCDCPGCGCPKESKE